MFFYRGTIILWHLKNAYLTVPMHSNAMKYLYFQRKGTVFEFTSLSFGLAPALLVFMKPVVSLLRTWGIRILLYLDDMFIMAKSPELLKQHLQGITAVLGFILNVIKCITSPTQIIEFLGFIINSVHMTFSFPS